MVEQLEDMGKLTVIRPTRPIVVDRMERNIDKLLDLYNQGYEIAASINFVP